jgi:two-component system phosphate regulon sensor histidine kinase PhoR
MIDELVLIALGAALGGLGVSYTSRVRLRRELREPAKRIVDVTSAITEGATSLRIEELPQAQNELRQIAASINRLAERASKDIEEMQRLERVRSEFIANVSHELRTPIFSVQGYLETLLDGAMDDPNVSMQFLEKAYQNAMRLNVLLNDLIDISRIESGELKFSFRYFDINELIHELVQTMQIRAEQRSVHVDLQLTSSAVVYGDKERLSQVLTNLIDNAIKYNVEGGAVIITTSSTTKGITVSVRDTGIGIPAEHLERIFERFYRVDKDRSRAVGGTGLGLAIVKHILEAHDAEPGISSESGNGTCIEFTLRANNEA